MDYYFIIAIIIHFIIILLKYDLNCFFLFQLEKLYKKYIEVRISLKDNKNILKFLYKKL